ncbi:MAG: lipid-A-disaccharide synthase, partial [Gammaproteobacteria bacterium]|nr:lipid-A-disaccharide synthase [Gammaproteobacteria bacterium]
MTQTPIKIAIVAAEHSGDLLGAGLIRELRQLIPHLEVVGVAGPEMLKAGCNALASIEELSVMGFIEPLKQLPRILKLRKKLLHQFSENPPAVFIGIDAPDFNLSLEKQLKQHGIPTVHYVSPSVWAWRQGRIHKIKKAVDLLLTLFPFETNFYKEHNVLVKYVGHPLADRIPFEVDRNKARTALHLSPDARIIALMPGSRAMELRYLGE